MEQIWADAERIGATAAREHGTPDQLVHPVEGYYGQYEDLLLASLARQPATMTVWLLNRVINAATGAEKS